jgi:uncharacterized LabA/DUF88 family protein
VAAQKPSANVYIDGFNLYRGCLEKSPYKWLDLVALAEQLASGHLVNRVRYFTAHVEDPAANQRQLVYLRALRTLRQLHVHDTGKFTTHTVIRPLADLPAKGMASVLEWYRNNHWIPLRRPAQGYWVRVSVEHKTEKGSDVNLATYLVADAFRHDMDAAWVVSGDSDLETPVRLVNTDLLPVHVVNPTSNKPSAKLQVAAATYSSLNSALLAGSQLPNPVINSHGSQITKPVSW